MKVCPHCSAEFHSENKNKKYCSYKCSNNSSSRTAKRKRLAVKKESQEGRNERTWKIMNMSIKEYCDSRPDKLKRYIKKDSLRFFARSWNPELVGLPCCNCGYDKHTELAHIKSVAEFPDSALLKEVHDKDNLKVLCPNCHWEFDNGLLNFNMSP